MREVVQFDVRGIGKHMPRTIPAHPSLSYQNLLLYLRAIFKHSRKAKIMTENPTEGLKARSKKRPSERYLSIDECRRLLSVLTVRVA